MNEPTPAAVPRRKNHGSYSRPRPIVLSNAGNVAPVEVGRDRVVAPSPTAESSHPPLTLYAKPNVGGPVRIKVGGAEYGVPEGSVVRNVTAQTPSGGSASYAVALMPFHGDRVALACFISRGRVVIPPSLRSLMLARHFPTVDPSEVFS